MFSLTPFTLWSVQVCHPEVRHLLLLSNIQVQDRQPGLQVDRAAEATTFGWIGWSRPWVHVRCLQMEMFCLFFSFFQKSQFFAISTQLWGAVPPQLHGQPLCSIWVNSCQDDRPIPAQWVEDLFSKFENLIGIEGALRRPMTYDKQSHPIHLSIRHIALNELNRPKIDLSQPSMN